jgi:hypothetical protein
MLITVVKVTSIKNIGKQVNVQKETILRKRHERNVTCTGLNLKLLVPEIIYIIRVYKNSVPTSQKTCCILIAKNIRLMLFREIIALHSMNHEKHTNKTCAKMQSFSVKVGEDDCLLGCDVM